MGDYDDDDDDGLISLVYYCGLGFVIVGLMIL